MPVQVTVEARRAHGWGWRMAQASVLGVKVLAKAMVWVDVGLVRLGSVEEDLVDLWAVALAWVLA